MILQHFCSITLYIPDNIQHTSILTRLLTTTLHYNGCLKIIEWYWCLSGKIYINSLYFETPFTGWVNFSSSHHKSLNHKSNKSGGVRIYLSCDCRAPHCSITDQHHLMFRTTSPILTWSGDPSPTTPGAESPPSVAQWPRGGSWAETRRVLEPSHGRLISE